MPQIEVTFDIDANGIVNVSAKDLGTGKQQQITISGSTALNDDEVERMVKDAEAHAEEDKRRKEEVEVRNNCDALVNATEQTLAEVGDKAPADVKSQAEEAIAEAKSALEGTDIDAIKAATEKMQQAGLQAGRGRCTPPRALPPAPALPPPRRLPPTTPSRPTTRWSTTTTPRKGSKSHGPAEHILAGARGARRRQEDSHRGCPHRGRAGFGAGKQDDTGSGAIPPHLPSGRCQRCTGRL